MWYNMSMDLPNSSVVRINITIPRWLLTELKKEVADGGKSGFVSQAIEEKLIRKKREKSLKELTKLPATFTGIKSGKTYIAKMREDSDKERSSHLGP